MSNLIIALIAILVIGLLALTGLYFGGNSMTDNAVTVEATRYRNEITQIQGALNVYKAAGNSIASSSFDVTTIAPEYLSEIPEGDWVEDYGRVYREDISEAVCHRANKLSGFEFISSDTDVVPTTFDPSVAIPLCHKADMDRNVPCCVNPL